MSKRKGPRPEKVQEVEFLRGVLEGSKAAILADYRGLDVKTITLLRRRLRDADTAFRVIKNTLIKRAAEGLPSERLVRDLEGPTAIAYTEGDAVAAAKALMAFVKEFKLPQIKGGLAEGQVVDAAQVQALASVAPRPVLLAQVVGGLQGPVGGLAGTVQQLYGQFVFTLQAVADQKQ